MKKILLLIIAIFLVFGIMLNAQDDDKRTFPTLGVKAGLNYSNVWDEKGENFIAESKLGFAGGFFLSIPFGKTFGVQSELMLSQKGFKGSGTLLGQDYSFKRTSTFLDVPLMLQVKPAEFITFFIGPQYSYLLKNKSVYKWGTSAVAQEQEFNNENIRKNILGFGIGADVNISHLVISGRLGWDLISNSGDGSSNTPRYKNQWLQITVGYKL